MKTEYLSLIVAFFALLASIAGTMFNMKKSNKGDSLNEGRLIEKMDTNIRETRETREDVRAMRAELNEMSKEVFELRFRLKSVEDIVFDKNKKEGDTK